MVLLVWLVGLAVVVASQGAVAGSTAEAACPGAAEMDWEHHIEPTAVVGVELVVGIETKRELQAEESAAVVARVVHCIVVAVDVAVAEGVEGSCSPVATREGAVGSLRHGAGRSIAAVVVGFGL